MTHPSNRKRQVEESTDEFEDIVYYFLNSKEGRESIFRAFYLGALLEERARG